MSHHHPGVETADAYPRRWSALATLLLAGFMNLIDITIVNVALPRLQAVSYTHLTLPTNREV